MSEDKVGYHDLHWYYMDERLTEATCEFVRNALDDLQREIGEWNARTFGDSRQLALATHLKREAAELHFEIGTQYAFNRPNPERIEEECADVLHLLLAIAHQSDFSLAEATLRKFAINQQRQWQKPDSEGVVEHKREP